MEVPNNWVVNEGNIHPFIVRWGFHDDVTLNIINFLLHEVIARYLSEGILASLES